MKKFVLISVAFLTMVLTTGCIKCSYDVEIDKDNNISVSETRAMNTSSFRSKTLSEDMDKIMDKNRSSMEEKGYEVTDYNEDNYKGVTKKKVYKMDKFYKLDLPVGFKANTKKTIETESLFGIKDIYKIDWTYSFKDAVGEDALIDKLKNKGMDSEKAMNMLKARSNAELVIKIPYKSSQNNATSVIGGKELHWNLIDENNDTVHIMLKYEKYNHTAIIGFLALIIAGVGFIILNKVLKRDNVVY